MNEITVTLTRSELGIIGLAISCAGITGVLDGIVHEDDLVDLAERWIDLAEEVEGGPSAADVEEWLNG